MTHPEETQQNAFAQRIHLEVLLRSRGNFDLADHIRDNTERMAQGERPWRKRGWQDEA